MNYKYEPTGQTLTRGKHFFDENGRQHAKEWYDWTAEFKAEIGIVEVEPMQNSPRPEVDTRFYRVFEDTPVNNTQVWGTAPKDEDVVRTGLIAEVRSIADRNRESKIVIGELVVSTDAKARGLLNGGRAGNKPTRKVVTSGGRVELSTVQFNAVVDAVDDHIQATFDNEYDLLEAIDGAVDFAALELIDIDAGWPPVYVEPTEPFGMPPVAEEEPSEEVVEEPSEDSETGLTALEDNTTG